eukprot:scaffold2368_cov289-Chaetoceros_neogracile.AAC.28
MAEQVQAILDRMVPSLRDLMDKEVFSEHEIKSIVARRRESEYLLRRRSARKSDYLRYIEAEQNLEKLRSLRNKMILAHKTAQEREERKASKSKKPLKPKSNSSIGDASIVQHLHLLFVRAKRKFKDDISFHVQHAEFAKEKKSFSILSKIYAEALQIHPRNTSLWIESASQEYFGFIGNSKSQEVTGGGSIKSARVLLQRGLRVNPNSQELWLQSFCLELHYIQKLRGRKDVLQLDMKKPKIVDQSDSSEGEEDNDEALESFYEEAKLPRIIYRNAIKAVPNEILFRVKFVEQCKLFPQTDVIVDEIKESIEQDFEDNEEAWIARANFAVDTEGDNDNTKKIGFLADNDEDLTVSKKRKHDDNEISVGQDNPLKILDDATDSIESPSMFLQTIAFVKSYIRHISTQEGGSDDLSASSKRKIQYAGKFLLQVVEKTSVHGIVSPELAIECTSVLLNLALPSNALEYIENLVKNREECRSHALCWIKYAEVKARVEGDALISCKIMRTALKVIPLHDGGYKCLLSKLFVDLLTLSAVSPSLSREKEIALLYEKFLLINHRKETIGNDLTLPALSSAYINHLAAKGNTDSIRRTYTKLIFNSNYPRLPDKSGEEIEDMKTLFDQCINVENICKKRDGTDPKQQKRQLGLLYDAAFQFFTQNGYSGVADGFTRRKNKELTGY